MPQSKRKLIVYRSEEAYRKLAGAQHGLVNFDYHKRFGVLDDRSGHTVHVDFKVADKIDPALGSGYDAVEFIGFGE